MNMVCGGNDTTVPESSLRAVATRHPTPNVVSLSVHPRATACAALTRTVTGDNAERLDRKTPPLMLIPALLEQLDATAGPHVPTIDEYRSPRHLTRTRPDPRNTLVLELTPYAQTPHGRSRRARSRAVVQIGPQVTWSDLLNDALWAALMVVPTAGEVLATAERDRIALDGLLEQQFHTREAITGAHAPAGHRPVAAALGEGDVVYLRYIESPDVAEGTVQALESDDTPAELLAVRVVFATRTLPPHQSNVTEVLYRPLENP